MAIRDLDQLLQSLEGQAEDELALLESTGPEYFTTAQLWRLRGQWEVKNRLFRSSQRWLLRLAAVSPGWIAGWWLLSLLGWRYLALLSLFLFPVSIFLFFTGLYYTHRLFRGKGHLDATGEMIVRELKGRHGYAGSDR
jgi:hypothetical protein